MVDIEKHIPFAKEACTYLTESPDPYHAILNSRAKLDTAGYTFLNHREAFHGILQPGGKYYYVLNNTTLVAFAIGPKFIPGNGFKIIGGHTDSPNLKVKPRSKRNVESGCRTLAVECYGGGLWHTWFDRDLGISGRVLVRDSNQNGIDQKFVKISKPIARVSTLCIHLQSGEERAAFKVNKEQHMTPILGTQTVLVKQATQQLTGENQDFWTSGQEPLLLDLIAKELQISTKDICDFELNLFDAQPAALGGIQSEFLNSGRLDNLATCFVAIESLMAHSSSGDFDSDEDVSVVVLFDHEEIGSKSSQGAGSIVMEEAIKRISASLNSGECYPDLYNMTIAKSFLFSVDQAHAIHPNYASKHEKYHSPEMNKGIVIKSNQNQRYATNSITGFVVRELCRTQSLTPPQEFVVRNDCPCGSTIGPMLSAQLGIRTVDLGMPQLSMHSCREVMGIIDLTNAYELFQAFFKHFRELDTKLSVCTTCTK